MPIICTNCTKDFENKIGVRLDNGLDLCKKCFKEYEKHWQIGPPSDIMEQ